MKLKLYATWQYSPNYSFVFWLICEAPDCKILTTRSGDPPWLGGFYFLFFSRVAEIILGDSWNNIWSIENHILIHEPFVVWSCLVLCNCYAFEWHDVCKLTIFHKYSFVFWLICEATDWKILTTRSGDQPMMREEHMFLFSRWLKLLLWCLLWFANFRIP